MSARSPSRHFPMNLIKGINQRSRWGFSGIKIREWQKNKINCAIIPSENVQTDKSRECNLFLSYYSTIIFWNNTYWYKLVFVSTARWHRLWQAASESNKHTNDTLERGRPLQMHITRFSLLKLEKQTQFERWWWWGVQHSSNHGGISTRQKGNSDWSAPAQPARLS